MKLQQLKVKHLLVVAGLAVALLLYTTYRQQHRLSSELHTPQHEGRREALGGAAAHANTDWHAVWAAARAAASETEFISAMAVGAHGGADNSVKSSGKLASAAACPPQRQCPTCAPTVTAAASAGSGGGLPHQLQQRPQQLQQSAAATATTPITGTSATAGATSNATATATAPAAAAVASSAASGTGASTGTGNWTRFVVGGQAPPISRELARSVARRETIIVTWANYALWDFVQTWVYHARDVGLENFIVGAMDAQIGSALVAAGVPCFAMFEQGSNHSGVGSDHLQWGGEAFHKMGRQKITLAQLFLGLDLDLLLVDVDVMLLGDVTEYFDKYPQADILVTSDQLASTIEPGDDGLELPDKAQSPMNIGFMFFRNSDRTVKFVDSWLAAINADPKYWDQSAFNDLARSGWAEPGKGIKVHPDQKRVFLGANGTLGVGVLPVASFSGGHTYYVQKLFEVQRVKSYAVHCTFQFGANGGKRNRLRESMLFYDPPEYYTGDNYISVELRRVPSATWAELSAKNGSASKRYHFRGLDMQLESVWPALRVSAVTNRSIIVPKLACYNDKYWTELDKGRVPGAFQTRIPFLCPLDHVLDPIFMTDSACNFNVRWREHSFLENPRCPDSVRKSRVTFYSSVTTTKPVEKWVVQEGGLVVLLPANLTEGAIKEMLKPYSSYKVWHLKDPELFFGGFDDKALERHVEQRISHLRPVMYPDPSPSPPPAPPGGTANANGTAAPANGTAGAAGGGGAAANTTAGGNVTAAAAVAEDQNAGMLTAVRERRRRS